MTEKEEDSPKSEKPMEQPKFTIQNIMDGIILRLKIESEYFSRISNHMGERGRLNELHLTKALRQFLPEKIGIDQGFIVSGGSEPKQSPQCDIILYDALNNPPFYSSEIWSVFPIEMVYGVIEVKTTVDIDELRDAFRKCKKIREMARNPNGEGNKSYIQEDQLGQTKKITIDLPPRFSIFGYKSSWQTEQGFIEAFDSVSEEIPEAHIHSICVLNDENGFFAHHIPYKTGKERTQYFRDLDKNAFHPFIVSLPAILERMLHFDRKGFGFDPVNLGHYLK